MATEHDLLPGLADILVVDDNVESLRLLNDILAAEGYKPRPVDDSQAALDAALARPPSLILLDVHMPGMSGFDVCRRLKADDRTRDVPVIFVSALDEVEDRVHGFEVGGVDFISKPIQETEVLARVRTHLELRYAQLRLEELVSERTAELERLLQKRSDELSFAEEQIRALFESSTLGVTMTTYDGRFLAVNQSLVEMLRTTKEALLQRHVADVYVDPQQREKLRDRQNVTGTLREFDLHLLRDDGTSFFARLNSSRINVAGRSVNLAMVDDITEQIEAEQEAAVLEERERLARELHDSVTQTLYSASLLADTIPTMWDKNQSLARGNLTQLGRLLRGGLAEMRTLLYELRPAAMQDQTVGQLLYPLVEAARTRTSAAVSLDVEGVCTLPQETTNTLFRIAQEALNNVAKHAEATEVDVKLNCRPDGVLLSILDNGCGFDRTTIPPGHLGVGIMGERARSIGADFRLDSTIGGGTHISVAWSVQGKGKTNG